MNWVAYHDRTSAVLNVARTWPWGTTDLFPSFGMVTF
jgi:hypothetical protein